MSPVIAFDIAVVEESKSQSYIMADMLDLKKVGWWVVYH